MIKFPGSVEEFSQDSINDSQETGSSTLIVPCENTLSTVKHNDDESVESASNSGGILLFFTIIIRPIMLTADCHSTKDQFTFI